MYKEEKLNVVHFHQYNVCVGGGAHNIYILDIFIFQSKEVGLLMIFQL